MKTAVIYARYSSDSQTEQSIEGQLHVCNEYAKSHNIVILRTYIDRAMSGKTDKRPDFQQMLKDSAQGMGFRACVQIRSFRQKPLRNVR